MVWPVIVAHKLFAMTWYSNPSARDWRCDAPSDAVATFHQSLANYSYTPIIELPTIAAELGVARVFLKDESARLNLAAFKVLGASWAVAQALTSGTEPTSLSQVAEAIDRENPPTLIAATDGNHGRAVAHMAKQLGLACNIVIPRGVSDQAIANVRNEDAIVEVLDATYDEAVDRAKEITEQSTNGIHIQDMSWEGYVDIPQWIIDGYTTLCTEVDEQLRDIDAYPAELVAVPVGVGSFLHSVVAHYRSRTDSSPSVLSVEPEVADCVLQSLTTGELTSVDTGVTIMSGMNCGTPSSDSWPFHQAGVDAAVSLTDEQTREALKTLHALGVDAGPCGAATLAGVRAALNTDERRQALGIKSESVIVLLSTEGRAANPAT